MKRPIPTILVLMTYAIEFYLFSKVVHYIPIGLTYAIWSGIGTFSILIIGRFGHNQVISSDQLLGVGIITTGVIIINLKQ